MTTRDVAFLHAMLHQDVQQWTYADTPDSRSHLGQRLARMRERSSEPLVTIIDYTRANTTRRVRFLADERAEDTDSDVLWDDYISRAARSGGRMELHLVRLRDGDRRIRRMMFPQRSDSAALHEGLVRIFSEVSGGSAIEEEEIRKLLTASESLVEIH